MYSHHKIIFVKICINNLVFTICYIHYQQTICIYHVLFDIILAVIALLYRLLS